MNVVKLCYSGIMREGIYFFKDKCTKKTFPFFFPNKHKNQNTKTITKLEKQNQNLSEQTQNSKVDKVSVCILEYRTYDGMDIHVYKLESVLSI